MSQHFLGERKIAEIDALSLAELIPKSRFTTYFRIKINTLNHLFRFLEFFSVLSQKNI